MRAVLRFVASVMMVSGALLITDAAVTLLWQEPVSAVVAHREQTRLKEALIEPPPRVIRRMPLPGDAIGRIEIPAIGVKDYVVEGTDLENLRKGPGHYPETPLPGDRGTVAIAGHRTTYGAPFRHVDELHRGQEIAVDMPLPHLDRPFDYLGYQQLVLSACHPLYSAAQRIVVFARATRRGPSRVRQR